MKTKILRLLLGPSTRAQPHTPLHARSLKQGASLAPAVSCTQNVLKMQSPFILCMLGFKHLKEAALVL